MRLSYNQISNIISVNGKSQDEKYLYADCPVCGASEFWMLFLVENQPCGCSRDKKCGWRGNIYTLLKLLNKSREFLSEREIDVFEKLEKKDFEPEIQEINFDLPEVKPPLMWRRVNDHPYLRERGIIDSQFEKFEIGVDMLKKDYVTFLVRQDQKVVGYISRSIKSKAWIDRQKELGNDHRRYDNSFSDFSKILFGYDEIIEGVTTDVILVEGIFSKTKTDANLLLDYLDEIKCVCTFGAKLSDHQIELLKRKGVKNLIFWFEADVLDKIKPILAHAAIHFNVYASYLDGKDPNDIGAVEARELLYGAKNWLEFNMGFVKRKLE